MSDSKPLKCVGDGCDQDVTVWSFQYQACDAHAYRYILATLIADIRQYYPMYATLQDLANAADNQLHVVDGQ